jgi:hypothetical protein
MQRLIGSSLFALLLATMIAPSAKAIRPELLPERVHPTIHTDAISGQESAMLEKTPTVQVSMQSKTPKTSEAKQSSTNERPSFEYFENVYRQRYGN